MKNLWHTVTKQEKHWLLIIITITLLMTSGPFVYAYLNTPKDGSYTGLHALTPGDTHVYYSLIEQVKLGEFLFEDLYTLEPHTKTLNIFWLTVGLGAKVFNLSPELAYQLARIILLPLLIILLYLLISFFFRSAKQRLFATTLAIFSSGVGALLYNILDLYDYTTYGYYHWPMDLWVAESNTYLTLAHSPHFIASLIGILGIFLLTLLAIEHKKIKYSLGAGLVALILYQFHPFQIFTTWTVLISYFLALILTKKEIIFFYSRHLAIILMISMPTLIYYWWLWSNDWLTLQKALQNITLTPAWWLTLISYGLLWPAAFYGIIRVVKPSSSSRAPTLVGINSVERSHYSKNSPGEISPQGRNDIGLKWLFLLAWLPAQIILIYSPLVFQRRLTTGLHIVIAILAAVGLMQLYKNLKKKYAVSFLSPISLVILVLTLSFSTLFNFAREIHIVNQKNELLYFPQDERELFNWINASTTQTANFLTLDVYGNFIPGQTGRRVFVGHGIESAFATSKFSLADWAYEQNPNADAVSLLQKNNIDFVVFSVRENTLSSNLASSPALHQEFSNASIQVYSLLYE